MDRPGKPFMCKGFEIINHFQEFISPARVSTYKSIAERDGVRWFDPYQWNIDVSSALWRDLAIFEVVLRNSIDSRLRERFGREDWWAEVSEKFAQTEQAQLHRSLHKGRGSIEAKFPVISPDDVVANLSLGFWVRLLSGGGRAQYETLLWQPTLRKAFAYYAGTRSQLFVQTNGLRQLRNRIAHHEPILNRHLKKDVESISRACGYVDPALEKYLRNTSRVNEVLNQRPGNPEST